VLADTVAEMTAEKEFAVETEKCLTCWAVRNEANLWIPQIKEIEMIWSESRDWSVWIHPNSWHQTWSQWTRQCLNRWWMMIEFLAS
jgi:hypothetical protein